MEKLDITSSDGSFSLILPERKSFLPLLNTINTITLIGVSDRKTSKCEKNVCQRPHEAEWTFKFLIDGIDTKQIFN